jgi:glycerol uptake facilitator-like aquaporin
MAASSPPRNTGDGTPVLVVPPPRGSRVLVTAGIELLLTALMLFVAVSATRLLLGSLPAGGHGWKDSVHGRLAVIGPVVGYTITALMLSPLGRRSGAHVNPAITLAMWRWHRTPGRTVVPVVGAQLLGSLLGPLAARTAWGPSVSRAPFDYAAISPAPGVNEAWVFAVEAATMFAIVAAVAISLSVSGWSRWTPWVVGTLIALQISALGAVTGGVANPARQFGPALLSGRTQDLVSYLLAPLFGSLLATRAVSVVRHHRRAGPGSEVRQPDGAQQAL